MVCFLFKSNRNKLIKVSIISELESGKETGPECSVFLDVNLNIATHKGKAKLNSLTYGIIKFLDRLTQRILFFSFSRTKKIDKKKKNLRS